MKTLLILNPERAGNDEVAKYTIRKAVRAVITNSEGLVGLVHVRINSHYKIPGGGMEKDESREEALKRECLEEMGCNIKIEREIGTIIQKCSAR